jgi:phage shock protein C
MIDGVCGGLAEYLGVDPTLVRLAWVLLTVMGGSGIILYIAAMILVPKGEVGDPVQPQNNDKANSRFWGFLLVGVGVVWLTANLGLSFWHHWWGHAFDVVIPVALVLLGVAFIFGGRQYVSAESGAPAAIPANDPTGAAPGSATVAKLYRSRTEKKIAGVCGGIGVHLGVDPVIIRLLFLVAALASLGFMLVAYLIMAIVIPMEPAIEPAVVTPQSA